MITAYYFIIIIMMFIIYDTRQFLCPHLFEGECQVIDFGL